MNKPLRIAQVTDCHLPADPRQTYRGIDPRRNLESLMEKVAARRPDLLLLTGDLSEDGSPQSYRVLRSIFGSLQVPLLALPGNHDDPDQLAERFPGSPAGGIGVSEHGDWQIVRLDSCIPRRPEGQIHEGAISALAHHLAANAARPQLVALHHQPVEVGNPWIDRFPLLNPQALLRLVDGHANVKAVVWGHIHQAYAADRNGTLMLGGPSSAINTLPGRQTFTPDPTGPACRWLELNEDQTLATSIVR
jgi:Icc protein